jgi:hypothetical protein
MNSANLAAMLMQADWEYADPVSGAVILVDKSGHVSFATGASGETNTLPNPVVANTELTLTCRSHGGGNRVITAAGAINKTGNTIMTFGATRDTIVLKSIKTDCTPLTFRWQVVANDGVALS